MYMGTGGATTIQHHAQDEVFHKLPRAADWNPWLAWLQLVGPSIPLNGRSYLNYILDLVLKLIYFVSTPVQRFWPTRPSHMAMFGSPTAKPTKVFGTWCCPQLGGLLGMGSWVELLQCDWVAWLQCVFHTVAWFPTYFRTESLDGASLPKVHRKASQTSCPQASETCECICIQRWAASRVRFSKSLVISDGTVSASQTLIPQLGT